MLTQSTAIELIRRFIHELETHEVTVKSSWLFGSYAKNRADDNSDVDVALVSEKFSGVRFLDRNLLTPVLMNFTDLEPHPFIPEDFNLSQPFAREILLTGIRVT